MKTDCIYTYSYMGNFDKNVCAFSVCTFTWPSTVSNEPKLSVRAIHHIVVIYVSMVLRTIYVTRFFRKVFLHMIGLKMPNS